MLMTILFSLVIASFAITSWLAYKLLTLHASVSHIKNHLDNHYQHIRLLRKADLNVTKKLAALENLTADLQNAQLDLKTDHNQSAYQQAMKMVEMGAGVDDVASTCHLGNAEAELLMNLQHYKNSL